MRRGTDVPDDDLDGVWKALSDSTRRSILDLLRQGPRTTTQIVEVFPHLTRFGVMKHIEVLREAGLIQTRDERRQRINSLNVVPIRQIYERWVGRFEELWASHLLRIKEDAEAKATDADSQGKDDNSHGPRKENSMSNTQTLSQMRQGGTKHVTGTRKEWLAARLELLKAEKELTRRSDELAQQRQALPWVPIDKEYRFETTEGQASLADLFRGRSQLLVYHFMFGPDYKAGCPSCSAVADGFEGIGVHLANHDVMLWAVSRAPLAKLEEYKRRMGWTFPWASSSRGDFNFDFNVSFTEEQERKTGVEYNYHREPLFQWRPGQEGGGENAEAQFAAMCGTDTSTYHRDRPGMSAFALEDGVVYHTYSTYARGLDSLWGMYQWLDRAPKGRNETNVWWRRHDEYGKR